MSAIAFPANETELDDRATSLVLVFIVLAILSSAAQLMFPSDADPQAFQADIVAMDD